jgi:hypothetical protein
MIPPKKTFYFVEPNYLDLIRKSDFQNVKIRLNLGKFDYIIGPFLKNNNHWCLFFVDVGKSEFFFCDPYIASPDDVQTFFDKWLLFLQKREDLNKVNWRVGNFKHSPQSDNINCGIIILMIVEKLLMNRFELDFDSSSLQDFRFQLYEKIREKSKDKKTFCADCGEIFKKETIVKCTKCQRCFHLKCYPIELEVDVDVDMDEILCILCHKV